VAAYPLLSVMALVETGTRALLGAVLGPVRGEVDAALDLIGHVKTGMLVLADRGFDANAFIRAIHGTGAAVLLRACASRKPTVLRVLHDGSYLSVIAGVPVRVIAATVTVTCADGSIHRGAYRLVTTLTDAHRHPATELWPCITSAGRSRWRSWPYVTPCSRAASCARVTRRACARRCGPS
jgi:hypothetical protein